MSDVPTITLNNGVEIPQLGFGVYQVRPAETVDATLVGARGRLPPHRHGRDVRQTRSRSARPSAPRASTAARCSSPRSSTTASTPTTTPCGPSTARLAALGDDYVDLFLIHWPMPDVGDYVETWRAMERILASGGARAIGVSNFQPQHLQRVLDETDVVPAVNQIEAHPYLTQDDARGFGAAHGIVTEAWSPIAQGKVLDDPVIVRGGRAAGPHAGPGHAAVAHPARRRRVPEVGDAAAGSRRTSPCSTSSSAPTTWTPSPASTATSASGPTPTSSTGSRSADAGPGAAQAHTAWTRRGPSPGSVTGGSGKLRAVPVGDAARRPGHRGGVEDVVGAARGGRPDRRRRGRRCPGRRAPPPGGAGPPAVRFDAAIGAPTISENEVSGWTSRTSTAPPDRRPPRRPARGSSGAASTAAC